MVSSECSARRSKSVSSCMMGSCLRMQTEAMRQSMVRRTVTPCRRAVRYRWAVQVQVGRPAEVVQALQPEHVKRTQAFVDETHLPLVANALQHLREGDVGRPRCRRQPRSSSPARRHLARPRPLKKSTHTVVSTTIKRGGPASTRRGHRPIARAPAARPSPAVTAVVRAPGAPHGRSLASSSVPAKLRPSARRSSG